MGKVALVTGASSGIGFETAMGLQKAGYTVYGAARRTERLQGLARLGIKPVALDVTDEQSMVGCIRTIGHVDLLVNNAGYGSYGAAEEVPVGEARTQLEVNLVGLARMTQLVLPSMREHRQGRIINISSIGGKAHTPFGAWYHATKYALEGFSDCLRMEVARFGIEVVVVEPGGIKTDWGVIAAENLRKTSGTGPYAKQALALADTMERMYTDKRRLSPPSLVARTVVKAATAKKPKTRYLTGKNARALLMLKRLLPDRTYDRLLLSIQKVPR